MRWVLCAVLLCAFASSAAARNSARRCAGRKPSFGRAIRNGAASTPPARSATRAPTSTSARLPARMSRSSCATRQSKPTKRLSNWEVLPPVRSTSGAGLGGFVGYNMQWQDIVLGFEANYNHVPLQASPADSEERSFVDSNSIPAGHHYFYDATVSERGFDGDYRLSRRSARAPAGRSVTTCLTDFSVLPLGARHTWPTPRGVGQIYRRRLSRSYNAADHAAARPCFRTSQPRNVTGQRRRLWPHQPASASTSR